jgi:hypothetical protein
MAKGLLVAGLVCVVAGVLMAFLIHRQYPKLLESFIVVSLAASRLLGSESKVQARA